MTAIFAHPEPPKRKVEIMFKLPGRNRNEKCPCGSDKKWKKCHPFLPPGFRPPILNRDDPPEKMEEAIDSYLRASGLVRQFS